MLKQHMKTAFASTYMQCLDWRLLILRPILLDRVSQMSVQPSIIDLN
jgi:hypothetical protein